MDIGYKSHIGNMRAKNQDAYLVLEKSSAKVIILAVADGLGGHNAGEIASSTLVKEIKDKFENTNIIDEERIQEQEVIEIIKEINKIIYEMGSNDVNLSKMGTTLCLSIIANQQVHIFHVGDSRAYIINEKEILQLTRDHSLVEQLISQGEISREEAETYPNKNVITRAIGTDEEIEVDYYQCELKKGDTILLCTDGLTNEVEAEEIKDIINKHNCEEAVEVLVQKANEYGGHDNITVIVYKLEVVL
mgnify:CR=1 FL=1